MGHDKAFLDINGKTFIENAVDILSPVCEDRIKIVLNPNRTNIVEKLPNTLPFIFDFHEKNGPLAGIHAALTDCRTNLAVVLACDMPFVTSETIKKLAKAAFFSKCNAIVPEQKDGRLQPLCAVYRKRNLAPCLKTLIADKPNVSVMDFLKELKIHRFNFENDRLFFNVNTPEDLERRKLKDSYFRG